MENVIDRDTKGRMRPPSGDNHYARRRPELVKRGDSHPFRKNPGLARRGKDHYAFGNPMRRGIGEENPCAKLTNETVKSIRGAWQAGGKTQRQIAADYGIDYRQVNSIILRKTWSGV